ncbi:MAG: carbamoyl transferase [Proteobacteria bacterium]|jgi:carbamoyltransferase|nr:carbamoyl transferase [Pseudomonadota bacterium]
MKILGVNFSNDSAAAIVHDGVATAASQEERFSRLKHDAAFPQRAIGFCLEHAGVDLLDLDAVAFFWNPGVHAEAPARRLVATPRNPLEYLYNVPTSLLARRGDERVAAIDQVLRFESGRKLAIHYVTHHVCHAAAAFFTSPFDEAAILTVDGYGERQSTGVYAARGARIDPVISVDFPHSLGSFYAAFTQYLGFRPNSGEGKVMGLASYGGPSEWSAAIREMIRLTDRGFETDLSYFDYFRDGPTRYARKLVERLGPARAPEGPLDQRHMDISYAVQAATEEALLHLARLAKEKTGSARLCVAGGVGLNCVANGRIAAEGPFDEYFFYPAAGDAGTSVGAALYATHAIHGRPRSGAVASEYLGPASDERETLRAFEKAGVRHSKVQGPARTAARMIADGAVIGWFQGRAEFGPRALGNRSILAHPGIADMKDRLNAEVKFRESFRPYAPSVVEEACGELFSSSVPSPYMLRAYRTLPSKLEALAAITHVDGTARVQTVSRGQNPLYHELLVEMGELTGVPVVLNTSFNIRGEPIVHSAEDALKCFLTTGLNALFVGDHLVVKYPA